MVVMLVIVRHLCKPIFAAAFVAINPFALLKIRSEKIHAVELWAQGKHVITNGCFWEYLQKLTLAGLNGVLFCPLLDNLHSLFHVFDCIRDTAAIFFVLQWAFRTTVFAFAQSELGFHIFNCVHSLTPY
jgi:hypothetical protein